MKTLRGRGSDLASPAAQLEILASTGVPAFDEMLGRHGLAPLETLESIDVLRTEPRGDQRRPVSGVCGAERLSILGPYGPAILLILLGLYVIGRALLRARGASQDSGTPPVG